MPWTDAVLRLERLGSDAGTLGQAALPGRVLNECIALLPVVSKNMNRLIEAGVVRPQSEHYDLAFSALTGRLLQTAAELTREIAIYEANVADERARRLRGDAMRHDVGDQASGQAS